LTASAPPVRPLDRTHRGAMRAHFVALDVSDRRLRFGTPLTDDAIGAYVDGIDFSRDAVFGVFDDELDLIGVAHVGVGPESAEFGVSVRPGARGCGVGSALFERANLFARTHMIRTMFMHCLLENRTMMHIARKSGMRIVAESGEADAYLELPPAGITTITRELMSDRVALFDFAMKSQRAAAKRFAAALAGPERSAED
jgi:GNAT superfamily N-acetyltransferase